MAPRRSPLALLALCISAVGLVHGAAVAPVTAIGPPKAPAVVTTAAYLSAESDYIDTSAWMRTLFGVQFDEDETKCAKEEKVFYRPMKQCYVLFRRGPCKMYEWLVFDKEKAAHGNLTVVCSRRKCAPNWGYDAASNSCFKQSTCVTPSAFHYTLYGEGECRCNGTTGRLWTAKTNDPSNCYELYHRQPCAKGMMLAPRYRLIEGLDAMCFRDPCYGYKPPVVAGNGSAPAAGNRTVAPSPGAVTPRPTRAPEPFVKTGPHDHNHHHHHHHHHHHGPPPVGGWSGFDPEAPRRPPPHGRESPNGDGPFDEGSEEGDFGVEVIPNPNRPSLTIISSTRADVASNNDHNHSSTAHSVPHEHNDWYGRNHAPGHLRGDEPSNVQHGGLPGFSISLKPLRLWGSRARRGAPRPQFDSRATRDARGDPDSRVDSDGTRGGQEAGGGTWKNPHAPAAPSDPAAAAANVPEAARGLTPTPSAANPADDYALEVQYSDGTTACMSPSQLNVACDLQMVPLFSDFSDVKVPVCVNALFRFAIGRLGKSDECAENDQGECATRVVVKSSEPLDWGLE